MMVDSAEDFKVLLNLPSFPAFLEGMMRDYGVFEVSKPKFEEDKVFMLE